MSGPPGGPSHRGAGVGGSDGRWPQQQRQRRPRWWGIWRRRRRRSCSVWRARLDLCSVSSAQAHTCVAHARAARRPSDQTLGPLTACLCLCLCLCLFVSAHSCSNNNFAKRTECNRCLTPKPTTAAAAGGSAGGARAAPSSAGSAARPGDWSCSLCAENNFRSRVLCHQRGCDGVKPGADPADVDAARAAAAFGAASSSASASSRNQDPAAQQARRFFDKIMKDEEGRVKIQSTRDAETFLRACLEYADEGELVTRLVSRRENGLPTLIDALTNHDEFNYASFVNGSVMPLLKRLGSESLTRGVLKSALDELLHALFMLERWMSIIVNAVALGKIDEPLAVGWMALQAVSIADELGTAARKETAVCDKLIAALRQTGNAACVGVAQRIATCVCPLAPPPNGAAASRSSSSSSAFTSARSLNGLSASFPGGRHSNDHANYRDVRIVPTPDELLCETPFLPCAADAGGNEFETDATLLDRQFRLLREELLAELREEFNGQNKDKGRTFLGCRIVHFNTGKPKRGSEPDELQPNGRPKSTMIDRAFAEVTFATPPALNRFKKQHELEEWWDKAKRQLGRQSLVCFVRDKQVICFGTVEDRRPNLLASNPPTIGIAPCSRKDAKAMLWLQMQNTEFSLVQSDASLFACEPILRSLQAMTEVPLSEEIVQWCSDPHAAFQRPAPPAPSHNDPRFLSMLSRIQAGESITGLVKSAKAKFELDATQANAIKMGLTHRLSITQGPPGTGKSFVGALLAKALFDTTNETILCVCYTNHALDQFLLDLVDHGLPKSEMVRVGGGMKVDSRLDDVRLKDLSGQHVATGHKAQRGLTAKSIEEIQSNIEYLQSQFASKPNLLQFLQREHADWAEVFRVNEGSTDGSVLVGKKSKGKGGKIGKNYLLDQWQHGSSAVAPAVHELLIRNGQLNKSLCINAFAMSMEARRQLEDEWRAEMQGELLEEYVKATRELDRAQAVWRALRTEPETATLQSRRIIGCTTTNAAMHRDALASVGAGVLIVEEAGEILESHVLTALSSRTKHCILIGDHQQLRPKVNDYTLQIESGSGFNLNVSLFERLVKADYPYATLQRQHRMHPQISSLVRGLTYPKLEDAAESVSDASRPMPRGLQQRVTFIDHRNLEDACTTVRQANDGDGQSNSKVCSWEVDMILRTLIYLMQQGYKESEITILTPYLGQLSLIRDRLRALKGMRAELSELDETDLRRAEDKQAQADRKQKEAEEKAKGAVAPAPSGAAAASSSSSPSASTKPASSAAAAGSGGVRLASIDNYQGEENEIILVSLVRSNPGGVIGFVGQNERINVCLSRARNGMILIGNMSCLANCKNPKGKRMWSGIQEMMQAQGMIQTGLPVVCSRHPEAKHTVSSPAEFDEFVPNGGCRTPCGAPFPCGRHLCLRKCHPVGEHTICSAMMEALCAAGHVLSYECEQHGTPEAEVCKVCIKIQKRKQAEARKAAEAARERAEKVAREQAEVAALKAQLEETAKVLADAEQSRQRDLEAARLKIEAELQLEQLKLRQSLHGQLLAEQVALLKLASDRRLLEEQQAVEERLQQLRADKDSKQAEVDRGFGAPRPQAAAAASSSKPAVAPRPSMSAKPPAAQQPIFSFAPPAAPLPSQPNVRPVSASAPGPAVAGPSPVAGPSSAPPASIFEPGKGPLLQRCVLCDKQFTSGDKQKHESQPAHIKKLADWTSKQQAEAARAPSSAAAAPASSSSQSASASPDLMFAPCKSPALVRCTVCNSLLDSSKTDAHLKSKEHLIKAENQRRASAGGPAPSAQTNQPATPVMPGPMAAAPAPAAASSSNSPPAASAVGLPASLKKGLDSLAAGDSLSAFSFFKQRAAPDNEPLNDASYLLALASHGVSEPAREQLMQLEQRSRGKHPQKAGLVVASYVLARLHHAAWNEIADLDPDVEKYMRSQHKASFISWAQASLAHVLPAEWSKQLTEWLAQAQKPESSKVVPLSESAKLKLEWEHARDVRGERSSALNSLFDLTGLASVKRHMLEMLQQAAIKRQQGVDPAHQRNNAIFSGNPGVGKTTVARLYAQLMIEIGALPAKAKLVETTGAQLVEEGPAGLKKLLADVPTTGLMLFVDEAYQLSPSPHSIGAQILNLLLTEMENAIGRIVVVFAGYEKDLEKILAFNVGLPSRFPHKLVFADYSDDELMEIAVGEMNRRSKAASQPFVVEGGANGLYMRVAVRRLGRGRDRLGFGNARAVQTMLDSVFRRQTARISRSLSQMPNRFEITREDLIGARPSRALLTEAPAWKELQSMIGLRSVKAEIERIAAQLEQNYDRELKGAKPIDVSLNRVFLGNPGTGKTTVAKLYGALLKQLGVLSKGDLVSKAASHFIGPHLGQSESQTKAILAASEGCVLMIDEAYGLDPARPDGASGFDIFRSAAVDTLVEGVQNVPGEDRAVLMLGYREEMERFFNGPNVNPGLKRRFGWTQAITFEDFSKEELNAIFVGELKKHELRAKPEVSLAVSDRLEQLKRQPAFGNAGSVKEILGAAILARTARIEKLDPAARVQAEADASLLLEDVQAGLPQRRSIDDIFSGIVGCESVKAQLKDLESTIRFAQRQGSANAFADVPRNFLFVGPPGVGKTSVARLMGELFLSFGLISSAEVLERSASDLSTQYAGSAGPSTMKVLRESLGKVLLIDEAYMLSPHRTVHSYGGQSLDELVKALTSADFHNKLIVILAGYDSDMRQLLTANAGLASRFPTRLVFEPFTVDQCWSIIQRQLDAKGFKLAAGAEAALTPLLTQLIAARDWGNGRDCGDLVTKTIQKRASVASAAPIDFDQSHVEVESAMLRSVMEAMLVEKKANERAAAAPRLVPAPTLETAAAAAALAQFAAAAPQPQTSAQMASSASTSSAAPAAPTAKVASVAHTPPRPAAAAAVAAAPVIAPQAPVAQPAAKDGRDPGVSDEVWRSLQAAIAAQVAREAAFAALQTELEAARIAAELEAEEAAALGAKLAAEADERRRVLLRKKHEEQLRRLAAEQAERDRIAALLAAAEVERKREAAAQVKLRQMGVCVQGFQWIKQSGGYLCAGGGHWVSDQQLR